MTEAQQIRSATLGWVGFALGAGALMLVILWAGPFAPQQPTGAGIGELAAEIAKSAARSVAGLPRAEAVAQARDIDDHLDLAAGLLAGLAVIAGVAALIREERRRAAVSGIALGALAMAVQIFAWSVGLIVGALVLGAVVYALRDVLGDLFDGLTGG